MTTQKGFILLRGLDAFSFLSSCACAAISSAFAVFSSSVENFSSLALRLKGGLIKVSLSENDEFKPACAWAYADGACVQVVVADEFVYLGELPGEVLPCALAVSAFDFDECSANAALAPVGDGKVRACKDGSFSSGERVFFLDFNHVFFGDAEKFRVGEQFCFEFFVTLPAAAQVRH